LDLGCSKNLSEKIKKKKKLFNFHTTFKTKTKKRMANEEYTIYYHGGFTGRAQPLVLLLEDAQAKYKIDTDFASFVASHNAADGKVPVFAPPIVATSDGQVWSQTMAIAAQLGARLGAEGGDSALQQALNIGDVFGEAFQARKSPDKGDAFLQARAGRWFDVLEKSVAATSSGGDYVFGERVSYVDFLLLSLVENFEFMFGERAAELVAARKRIVAIAANVKARPNVAAYFKSDRYLPILVTQIFG
jgi:glutathione S-transferase